MPRNCALNFNVAFLTRIPEAPPVCSSQGGNIDCQSWRIHEIIYVLLALTVIRLTTPRTVAYEPATITSITITSVAFNQISMTENFFPSKTVISGAPEGFDATLVAAMAKDYLSPILHIVTDDRRMASVQSSLEFFAPECTLLLYPAWDCPPYSRISPHSAIVSRRMATLTRLIENPPEGPCIVLATVNAAIQRTPTSQFLEGRSLHAKVGDTLTMESTVSFLEKAGYQRSDSVHGAGEYALRGGILDIFPTGRELPIRLDFFGDRLDGIRIFDPETQMSDSRALSVQIGLESEISLNTDSIALFRSRYRAQFGVAQCDDRIYQAVSEGHRIPGLEQWLPFFHQSLASLFDYLPESVICIDEGVDKHCQERWENLNSLYSEHQAGQGKHNSRLVLEPFKLHLTSREVANQLQDRDVKQLTPRPLPVGYRVTDAGARKGRDFAPERAQQDLSFMTCVAAHLMDLRRAAPVLVACWSEGSRDRLGAILEDHNLSTSKICSLLEIGKYQGAIDLAVFGLEHGFISENFAIISEQDIFGEKLVRKSRKRGSSRQLLAEARDISHGDLVVHEDNGIGRYLGLQTVTAAGVLHDCVLLEYAGGSRLYLPVEHIDLLTKYGPEDAPLDRLGAASWQERKSRLKNRLLDIAHQLLATAAQRSMRQAPVFAPDGTSWDSFLARFQFRETEDQIQAVEDVLSDLATGQPMDRLICGDVGFGKTEVAMRAAFVVAMQGFQVAMVAPTTLLVRQHFETFRNRFAGFPIEIRQLSRNVSRQDADAVHQSIEDGSCDIVIGTHALLAKSISFKRLGLVIFDEEQSFGVSQKEILKELRASVHVLALTATPIPRTLQMALNGVRDLSIIATPPADRLAIRTYILEFEPVTIRSALLHEHYRGGQSFIVAPRVKDLPELTDFLEKEVPEISFTVAHGQMSKDEMEARTEEFYDGKYDLLLSTTIIAAGIDIPTANTIVIVRADRFGLAQLYQIRGRVGRSGLRAFAYMTYGARSRLTEAAQRRFDILASLDSLGAGFRLAAQDLDLRGSGNLLGTAQSGHIREVGVELFQKMLADTVASLKANGKEPIESSVAAARINLHVSAQIPESYVSDLSVRLGLYRRIAALSDVNEIDGFGAELVDRFGQLPTVVNTLLEIVRIKILCRQAGVSRMEAGPKGASIEFQDNQFTNLQGLIEFTVSQGDSAKFKNNKLILRGNWSDESIRLRGATGLAIKIAQIADQSA